MPIPLPPINLSSLGVGQSVKMDLSNVGIGAGGVSSNPANTHNSGVLWLFNDSGCGLSVAGGSNSAIGFNLPAGAWKQVAIPAGEYLFIFTVLYTLPNPPISLLMAEYYLPNEAPPVTVTLGNSPIGGGVSTSAVQTLSNEGGARNLLVIDIGDLALANLINFYTDHFLLKVDQGGVAHQVLSGNIAGNPLQIGQAGDITEVLGQLTIDQAVTLLTTLAVTGLITATGGVKTNTIQDNTGVSAASFAAPVGVSGTSGSFSPNYVIWGQYLKILHIGFVGYANNVTKLVTFPSTFARGKFWCGSLGDAANTIQPRLSGVGVQCEVIKTLATGSAGGLTDLTNNIFRFAHGNIISSIDSLIIGTTVGAANGGFTLIGA